jgi:hypothetical protein
MGILPVDRAHRSVLKPQDPDQVGDAGPEPVEHAVMGAAVPARTVVHRHRRDPPAAPEKEGGEKAMHMVEVGNRQKAFPAEQLEPAAAVARGVAQTPFADRIGHATSDALDPWILPAASFSNEEPKIRWSVGRPDDGQEAKNIRGIVLTVAIQGGDPDSPRGSDTMRRGSALARSRPVADDCQPGKLGAQRRQEPRRVVVAAVVHAHELILRQTVQRVPDLGQEPGKVGGLVVDRYHH